jgi:hypothetical protein
MMASDSSLLSIRVAGETASTTMANGCSGPGTPLYT